MNNRFAIVITLLGILLSIKSYSQSIIDNSDVAEELQEMFGLLDKDTTKITTGYLLDQAVDLVDIRKYDGISLNNDNYADIGTFRNFFLSINTAKVNVKGTEYNANAIVDALAQTNGENTITLGAALVRYNYIVDDALTGNKMVFTNGKADDLEINGIWQNPYNISRAFVFSSSVPYHEGMSVTFVFDPDDHFWGNQRPVAWEFNPGNNNSVYSPVPSTGIINVTYTSEGIKELKLKAIMADNSVYEGHSNIYITPSDSQTTSGTDQSWEWRWSYSNVETCGETVSATVTCKTAASHNGKLVKPIIYVEGFDDAMLATYQRLSKFRIDTASTYHYLYDVINKNWQDAENFDQFISEAWDGSTLEPYYDVIYVDWGNPRAKIQANAKLLEIIITDINGKKAEDGCSESNVIIGHSMGGLIARYALVDMEDRIPIRPHQTSTFISYDAPHLGANVPIGAQYVMRDFYGLLYGDGGYGWIPMAMLFKSHFKEFKDVLECNSARQMMYHYVGSTGPNDNVHCNWQDSLALIGFPKGYADQCIENVAITNGGNQTLNNNILQLNIGGSYLPWNLHTIVVTLCTLSNVDLDVTIGRDTGYNTQVSSATISYSKQFAWLQNPYWQHTLLDVQHNSHCFQPHCDNNLSASYINHYIKNIDTLGFHLDYVSGIIPFVPTASALALTGSNINYNRDFYSNPPAIVSETPFDAYIIESDSKEHGYEIYHYDNYIYGQLDSYIIGGSLALTNDFYTIHTPWPIGTSVWSVEGTGASINSSTGQVTVSSAGLVKIKCRHDNGPECYCKTKRVLAGFPDMNLNTVHQGGNDYSVTATCVSSDNELRSYVDTLAARGVLKYIWGIKNSDNTYTWSDTTSTRSFAYTVQPNSLVHVCMKLCDSLGRVSTTINDVEIDRRSTVKYLYEPDIMTVTSLGSIYHYQYLSGTTMLNNHYFCTWKNPDYSPAPAAPDNITVKGDYIPLKTSYYTNVAGVNTTVYCFEFLQSSELQDAIDEVLSDSSIRCAFIPIQIRNGTTVLQDVMFYVEKPTRVPDLPQPPH